MKPLKAHQGPWDILSQTAGNLWKHKVLQVKPLKNLIFLAAARHFGLKTIGLLQKCPPQSPQHRTSLTLRVKLPQELHTFLYENLWRKMFAHQVGDFRDDFFHLRAEISRIFLKINSFLWIPLYICSSHFKNPWFWQAGGGGRRPPQGGDEEGLGVQGLPWGHSISAGFLVFISK